MEKLRKIVPGYFSEKWMMILLAILLLFAWQMCASYQRSADIEKKLHDKQIKNLKQ